MPSESDNCCSQAERVSSGELDPIRVSLQLVGNWCARIDFAKMGRVKGYSQQKHSLSSSLLLLTIVKGQAIIAVERSISCLLEASRSSQHPHDSHSSN